MSIYFKDGAFYIEGFNDYIPDDALEVSQELYDSLFEGQANGKMIATCDDGMPCLKDKPLPSKEVLVQLAEQKRSELIDSAMQSVSVLNLKLQAGRKLTTKEMDRLSLVLDYIDLLEAVDISNAPDTVWPESP